MKKIKWLVLFLVSTLLIVWMFFSTTVIADYRNRENIIVEQDPLDQESVGLAFFNLTEFEQIDSLFDTISLFGEVYNISHATDEQASRSLILSSTEKSYWIPLPEIYSWFENLFVNFDQTPKKFTGFAMEFCPLNFSDGEYKLILQVEENGIPVTRSMTGYVLEKKNGHVQLLYKPSEKIEDIVDVKNWANAGINELQLSEDGILTFTGWAIMDSVNSTETNVFIQVKNGQENKGTFSTTKKAITHIAAYFENTDLYEAGFMASIPNVSTEDLKIYVFVEYQGLFYQCSYHFETDSKLASVEAVYDYP